MARHTPAITARLRQALVTTLAAAHRLLLALHHPPPASRRKPLAGKGCASYSAAIASQSDALLTPPLHQEPNMITSLKLNAILSTSARFASLAMATTLTLAVLAGVNGLATSEAPAQVVAHVQHVRA
jgi:hypothetical protein